MMKKTMTTLALAAGMLSASCQSSSYKVEVTGEALGQADTLLLCKNVRQLADMDTIVGVEGKYVLEGTADSTLFAVLFVKQVGGLNQPLFLEPGTIRLHLSEKPAQSKVGGTPCNDGWQEYSDSILAYGAQIDALAAAVHDGNLTEQEQQEKKRLMDQLSRKATLFQASFTKKHIKDELGYFMLVNFGPGMQDDEKAELLALVPEKFGARREVVAMKKQLELSRNTAVGKTLPDYTMDDMDGKPTSLLSLVKQNKLTVLDFWASWCGPCRAEMPTMVKMHADLKDKGLGIVGISLDNDHDKWAAATKQLGIAWPQLSDLKGWGNGLAKLFAVNGIPYTVVIDQQGKIVKKGLRGEELVQFVSDRLK